MYMYTKCVWQHIFPNIYRSLRSFKSSKQTCVLFLSLAVGLQATTKLKI